jgi:predicted GTPase
MGATGSGKSSVRQLKIGLITADITQLVNRICKRDVAEVGHDMESTTQEVESYTTVVDRQSVTLIDSPGFHDTHLSDSEILKRISSYLQGRYENYFAVAECIANDLTAIPWVTSLKAFCTSGISWKIR